MTTYQGIAVASQTLGYLVSAASRAAVPQAVVTMLPPEEQPAASKNEPRVNVYLVQVVPDLTQRNADLPMRSPEGNYVATPRVPVDLRYLLSFFGPPIQSQLMLGAVQVALREHAYLDPTVIANAIADRAELQGSGLETQQPPVQLAPRSLSIEELTRFWSGFFQAPYTLSLCYDATPIILEGDVVLPTVPIVRHPPVMEPGNMHHGAAR